MARAGSAAGELARARDVGHNPSPLTPGQLAAFEANGAVTVDTPLSPELLDAAERAWDRAGGTRTVQSCSDAGFISAVGHPVPCSINLVCSCNAHSTAWRHQVLTLYIRPNSNLVSRARGDRHVAACAVRYSKRQKLRTHTCASRSVL